MVIRGAFLTFAIVSLLGCGGGFQSSRTIGGASGDPTSETDPQFQGDRPFNPETMLAKTCLEPYSWEGATGTSSSLQIIQKPETAFDYAADYKAIYKELSGRELSAPLDELTQPLVLIPHLTLYTFDSPPAVQPSGEVILKFGVKLADLVSSFTDVWLGSIPVEEVVFKSEIENYRGHICAESLALEFTQAAPGTAKLILISAKSEAERGLLVRLWLLTQGSGVWRSIGYTWIDRRALIGPASVPMEKERNPASEAETEGPPWFAWVALAAGVLAAIAMSQQKTSRMRKE